MISVLGVDASDWPTECSLRVVLTGSQTRQIRPETDMRRLSDIERDLIDPVALLAAASADGLFSGQAGLTGAVRAEARRADAAIPGAAEWTLQLNGVDVGAIRLLVNMSNYLEFDSGQIRPAGFAGGFTVPATSLPFPSCGFPKEFAFDYERPAKSRGERGVRLTFANPPDDATLDRTIAALDKWAAVVMAGAYVTELGHAGALAEAAALEETCVVGLTYSVCIGMTELMFSPVINLAGRLHALQAPLKRLEIV